MATVMLFKMLFIGYLCSILYERCLVEEVYTLHRENVYNAKPYLACLKRQKECFDFKVEAVVLGVGNLTIPV
ncbi:hypothetical protein [Polycladomyces subterraneus]|uniref:Secreted protein n=1 Tax=Polycladomyces subterraneus TaxID=1016997 RepID=A0ABT8IM05_9BACL|nr:hypothetical protein [Polycladomyces subterraneus]MDN4593219.1 hypothetical protein [Polycladomyces subterraneus]